MNQPHSAVSVSVDDHQPSAGPQHAPHLRDGAILTRVMVEAVGAGHDVERSRGERQAFAVSLHRQDVSSMSRHRAFPLPSMSETRSTPQTSTRGKQALTLDANKPVPQPTSSILIGRSPAASRIRLNQGAVGRPEK